MWSDTMFRFLSDFFVDHEYGGVFSAVDALGTPVHCDDKQLADQALALLSIARFAGSFARIDPTPYLIAFNRLKDKEFPGYTELTDRYWYPHPSGKIRTIRTQLLTSLALMEAGNQFQNDKLLNAGLELIQTCFHIGLTKNFPGVVSQDWSGIFDSQPCLKSAALFVLATVKAIELRPQGSFKEKLPLALDHLHRFVDHQYGGLYEKLSPNFQPLQSEPKYLSSMALAIIALLRVYQIRAEQNLLHLALSLADFIQDHYYDPAFQGYWHWCSREGTVQVFPYTNGASPFPVKLASDHALLFSAIASLSAATNTKRYQQFAQDVLQELVGLRDRRQGGMFQGQGNWWSSPVDPTVPLTRHFGVPSHTPGAFQSGNTAYIPFQVKQASTQALALLALTIGESLGFKAKISLPDSPAFPPLKSEERKPSHLVADSRESACDFKIDVHKYIAWLHGTKVPGGAFGLTPYRSPLGLRADRSWQVFATVHVIADLKLLGQTIPEEDAVIQALQSCQNDDGGFGEQPGHPSDVFTTYCGVLALHLLNQTPQKCEQCIAYLRTCQNIDGGLGNFPGYRSDLWHTNLAVAALRALGAAPLNAESCAAFVYSCIDNEGAYSTRPGALPEVFSAYRGIGTLFLLEREIPSNAKTICWLQACQTAEGGFIYRPGRVNSFVGTYHALAALYLLKELPDRAEACKQWLAMHQNPDGGFSRPLGTPSATTDEGFISLHSAFMLDSNISRYWVAMIS